MLNLVIIGLNHRTADLDVRQQAAFPADQLPEILLRFKQQPGIQEGMIVSTCNRVELLSRVDHPQNGVAALEKFFSENCAIPAAKLLSHLYHYIGRDAVNHVFRVASSLDSMILGEAQILGQVKNFFGIASSAETIGYYLNNLMQAAFHTAKRVRTETRIGEFPVSASSAAVELSRKVFGDLKDKAILVVGSGKMGEVAVRHMVASGAKIIRVANRNPEAAHKLADRFHGQAVRFDQLAYWLIHSDIIITSTGSRDILIDRPMAQKAASERRHAPMIYIDISVPRNVDPSVTTIDNVFAYDIDDLGAVVEANLTERRMAASHAERIIEEEIEAFCTRIEARDVGPVISRLQGRIEEMCSSELQRFLKRNGSRDQREIQELEAMVSRIAGKLAHPLISSLRSNHHPPNHRDFYLDTLKRIFKL
jgi:glutamyl-tRNA reductase